MSLSLFHINLRLVWKPHWYICRLILLAVAALLEFAAIASAKAQVATARLEQIQTRGTLLIGTTGDYRPFSYRISANSPYIGFDIEMAQSLAEHLGVKLVLVHTTWPTLMRDLAAGHFDVAMSGVSISAEREKSALFSIPYLRDGKTPISLCSQQAALQTLTQIDQANVKLIVNPGGTNERFVREHVRHAQIIVFPDNNRIFEQIVEGKADLMITDAIEARLQQQLQPRLCALHPEAPFNVSEKAYLLPQDQAWKAFVDRWLQTHMVQDKLQTDLDKWLRHPWPQTTTAATHLAGLRDLMAQRLSMMQDVARHKWNQQSAIEDLAREQKIIASLQQQARALGVPAAWAEQFFRAQIEAAKQIQRDYFAQWEKQQQAKFDQVPNLDTVIRPRLDQLTTAMLRQLALSWPLLIDQDQRAKITEVLQNLSSKEVSDAAVKIAIGPLLDASALSHP